MAASSDAQQGLKRPRYFDRQQLKAEDLTLEQRYVSQRLGRLNRHLHGCGVVCGLEVQPVQGGDGSEVLVTPGLALSPQGEEIFVASEQTVPVCLPRASAQDCRNLDSVGEAPEQAAYIAVKYVERHVDRVPPIPKDCDPPQEWEYSRTCESFETACLDYLPSGCAAPDLTCGDLSKLIYGPGAPDQKAAEGFCPPQSPDPWVVLAKLCLTAEGELVIDYGVRSEVIGGRFLDEILRCGRGGISSIVADSATQGETIDAVISGWGLDHVNYLSFSGADVDGELIAEPRLISTQAAAVEELAYSPDGRYVASRGNDRTARVLDVRSGFEVARLSLASSIRDIAFSPKGDLLAVARDDGTLSIWAYLNDQQVSLVHHGASLRSMAYSPVGPYVVTVGMDNRVRVWEERTGRLMAQFSNASGIRQVFFSPDGHFLWLISDDRTVSKWTILTGARVLQQSLAGSVSAADMSADGRYLGISDSFGTVRIFDTEYSSALTEIRVLEYDASIYDITFSPDGNRLAVVAGSSGDIRIHEVVDGRPVARVNAGGYVTDVIFSPNGRQLAARASHYDHEVGVWHTSSGNRVTRLTHDGVADKLAFSPDSTELVTSDWNGNVRSWRMMAGDGSHLPVRVTVGENAALGLRTFQVLTDEGVLDSSHAETTFTVNLAQPRVSSISPDNGQVGSVVVASIFGQQLSGAVDITFPGGGVSGEIRYSTATSVGVRLGIDLGATTGFRPFRITTPRGIVDSSEFGVYFRVWSLYYGDTYPYGGSWGIGIGGDLL